MNGTFNFALPPQQNGHPMQMPNPIQMPKQMNGKSHDSSQPRTVAPLPSSLQPQFPEAPKAQGNQNGKRRYRLLNEQELRENRRRQSDLQARFDKDKQPSTKVRLLEERLQETESFYQLAKDGVVQLNADLVAKDQELGALNQEINEVAAAQERTAAERDQAVRERDSAIAERCQLAGAKRKRDEEYDQLDSSFRSVRQKLDKEKTQNLELNIQLTTDRGLHQQKVEAMTTDHQQQMAELAKKLESAEQAKATFQIAAQKLGLQLQAKSAELASLMEANKRRAC